MPTFAEFTPTLNNFLQQGFIARWMEEGLDSNLAFARQATSETIGGHIGSSVKIAKSGRKAPVTTAMNPANLNSNLNNGMNPSTAPTEQYEYDLQEWGDTDQVDLLGNTALAADNLQRITRNNAVQAAQSIERLAKIELHGCYNGGNTFVRPDLGANSTTSVHVDDIRGFEFVSSNGVYVPVSSNNPLTVFEVRTSYAGVNQSFQVINATPDGTTASLFPFSSLDGNGNALSDGVSGVLTIQGAAVAPVGGDALIAINAPKVVRPLNKPSTMMLSAGDTMTLNTVLNARKVLLSNGVPLMPDGTYHFLHSPNVQQQLFSDPMFIAAFNGAQNTPEYQDGRVFRFLGITFICTTETYVQPPCPALGLNVPVERSILMGAGALNKADYAGLESYLGLDLATSVGAATIVGGIAQIYRSPLDLLLRFMSATWTWVGCFLCPTDRTATNVIIPTANAADYKRAVVIETAG